MAKKLITKAEASKAATVVANYTKQEAKMTSKAFSKIKKLF